MIHKVGANLQCQGFHDSIVTLVCATSENGTKKNSGFILFYVLVFFIESILKKEEIKLYTN